MSDEYMVSAGNDDPAAGAVLQARWRTRVYLSARPLARRSGEGGRHRLLTERKRVLKGERDLMENSIACYLGGWRVMMW